MNIYIYIYAHLYQKYRPFRIREGLYKYIGTA